MLHAKYMVIDPWGASPLVIQGSANWTATALVMAAGKTANDEDIQFLPHAGIAQAFAAQFGAMTDGLLPLVEEFRKGTGGKWSVGYWHPPGSGWRLETSGALGAGEAWKKAADVPGARTGRVSVAESGDMGFFRLHGE